MISQDVDINLFCRLATIAEKTPAELHPFIRGASESGSTMSDEQ
jgi:hypothetical protein